MNDHLSTMECTLAIHTCTYLHVQQPQFCKSYDDITKANLVWNFVVILID